MLGWQAVWSSGDRSGRERSLDLRELPAASSNFTQGVKLLPNGDFLMAIGANSSRRSTHRNLRLGTINEIREVNLAGDTVREITITDLNAALANCHLRGMQRDSAYLPS